MQEIFARKYVNYLVPALAKISKESNHEEIEKIVRYEADMALVLSPEGCAWSHALKHKLQLNVINVDTFPGSSNQAQKHLKMEDDQNAKLLKKISANVFPNDDKPKRFETREMQAAGTKEEVEIESEEKEMSRKLTYIRTLLPGGSEMVVNDLMLSELGSYIFCLELQVNILRSMVQII
ncbi:hypothetical protein CCACVL1_01030 [Corchorus capsularis]|uniref:IBH1-like N-terminal domain-containing protein n=1 Tax=Corchorus capsularis TaxID=210143 RepID=A0A1R3KRX4_COCAP|nr:hypothetical protein CCACVL1_01030 [Corchorus capsularis]